MLILAFVLHSCDQARYHEQFKEIPQEGWDYHDSLTFEVPVNDTLGYYNFMVHARHGSQYPYANMHLFITSLLPDGRYAMDTLTFAMARPDGKWLGTGIGNTKTRSVYFQKDVIFPAKGNYRFLITHGMRDTLLLGVEAMGFRVERVLVNK